MFARYTAHWIFLGGLLLLTTLAVLFWSTRGAGNPDPHQIHQPVAQIGRTAAEERSLMIMRSMLLCLDAISKHVPTKAVTNCSTAIALLPNDTNALKLRGTAYLMQRRNALAAADFDRAVQLRPGDADAYRYRARAYELLRRDALALADYDHAVALGPRDAANFEVRGYFHQTHGHYRKAIADFSSEIALKPRLARAWNSRCWTRAIAGVDLAKALTDCNMALKLDPGYVNALDSRGVVLLRLAQYRPAIASFTAALAHAPKLASSLYGRGLAKFALKDLTAAKDVAAAKAVEPGIEARFASYGIRPLAGGPSGI
jgi:tetratricopeptide (TPR) repeat protein